MNTAAVPQELQWLEFFAGSRMATRCVGKLGYRASAIDLNDAQAAGYALSEGTAFDILSPSGFVFLCLQRFIWFGSYEHIPESSGKPPWLPTSSRTLRLAIQAILQSDAKAFVVWFGTKCSTWSAVSRGSTLRSWLAPLGDTTKQCVRDGNLMVSRTDG